jgi:hypothetical protein
MTIINFPGTESSHMPDLTQEDKIDNIRNDLDKLEEYLDKAGDYVDGVLLVTFSKHECHHWITAGLSVPDIYFMLSRIQNSLIEYADALQEE